MRRLSFARPLSGTTVRRLALGISAALTMGLAAGCTSPSEAPAPGESGHSQEARPILMTRAQLEASVAPRSPKPLSDPYKIFLEGNRLYLVDRFKGVHIYDNSDPASPQALSYVTAPGITDLIAREGRIILNQGPDMVCVDVRQPATPEVAWRRRRAFIEPTPPEGTAPVSERPSPDLVVLYWQNVSTATP